MPPARLATSREAAFCSSTTACAERAPERHTVTTGRSRASSLARAGSSRERDQPRAADVPERAVELVALAHVDDLHRAACSSSAAGCDLPDAGERERERRPVRLGGGAVSCSGRPQRRLAGTAMSISFGMRQAEVAHVADEVAFADRRRRGAD